MGQSVARVGDHVEGFCDGPGHELHHPFIGTWTTGSGVSTADGMQIVRVGDRGVTDCGHHIIAEGGSTIVTDQGIGLHRVGDSVIVEEGGTGTTTTGSGTFTSN